MALQMEVQVSAIKFISNHMMLTNGPIGILHGMHFKLNANNECILTSCIVETNTNSDCMPWLNIKEVPILASTNYFTIKHQYDDIKLMFNQQQVPISPTYSMTMHKFQGQIVMNMGFITHVG